MTDDPEQLFGFLCGKSKVTVLFRLQREPRNIFAPEHNGSYDVVHFFPRYLYKIVHITVTIVFESLVADHNLPVIIHFTE